MASKYVSSFLINDFETGGLDATKNAVCEWAGVAIDGDTLQEICRDSMYAQHGYSLHHTYDQAALNVTGISIEDLIESGLPLNEFVERITEVCRKANERSVGAHYKTIMVGHSYGFDVAFMQQCFTLAKKDLSKLVAGRKDYWGNFQPDYIDTQRLGQMKWQNDDQMINFKLGTCIEKSGLELNDAHRAMNDVIANQELFINFCHDLRYGHGSVDTVSKKVRHRNHFQFV